MRVKLVRPLLRPLPDLGEHQITAAQLATNGIEAIGKPSLYKSDHIGRTVAIRHGDTIIAGPLRGVLDSVQEPQLFLQVGDFSTAVHPTHPVTVAPAGYRLTVTAQPRPVSSPATTTRGEPS